MGTLIGWLIAKGLSERLARVVAIGGLFALILGALGTAVCAIRKDAVDDHEIKVERRARPATDKAAEERARDSIDQAKDEQEAHDAIAAQPDQPISPTSRALACKRLRDAGRDPPACR